ncbi:MAG: 5-formyltetrahydrofolate cyclo-ligase [Janthinobacterium lividum]
MAVPHSDPPELVAAKRAARDAARLARGDGDPVADRAVCARLLSLVPPDLAVSGTWPLPGELDLRPLLAALHARGQAVLLPETTPRGTPLVFRRWTPDTPMVAGRFGTSHPDSEAADPQLLLVPLLAFDDRLMRLGYGGGYYDRTLAGLPGCRAIGFAYARQQVASIPTGPFDMPLDAIVTEAGILTRHEQ